MNIAIGPTWFSKDYDETPRPIVALADEYPAGFAEAPHSHRRAQLLYASAGVMSVMTEIGSFVVPPQRAVWLPPNTEHEISCRSPLSMRTLYIETDAAARLPATCSVIVVSDLLKALVLAAVDADLEYDEHGRDGLIAELLLQEIARAPIAPLHAPMPKDPRLLRVCRRVLANPAMAHSLDDWANIAGMGRRTLTRLFRDQTGMSMANWHQHVRLLEALSLIAEGRPITAVAYDVGYANPSAFTASFHRTFGVAPSHYFRESRRAEAVASMKPKRLDH